MASVAGAGIATVAVSLPDRSLLDPAVMASIIEELEHADAAPDVTGILLTGTGEVFCGGLDIAAIRAGADPVMFATALVELLRIFPRLHKPIVARVNGDAVASGASLVAACDFAVAVPTARIGTLEVGSGIWPMVAQVPLIARLGVRAAMENIGSGIPFTAVRAAEVGLVNRVVEPEDLDDACQEWLAAAARGGAAVASGRPLAYELDALPYDAALERALGAFTAMFEGRA